MIRPGWRELGSDEGENLVLTAELLWRSIGWMGTDVRARENVGRSENWRRVPRKIIMSAYRLLQSARGCDPPIEWS